MKKNEKKNKSWWTGRHLLPILSALLLYGVNTPVFAQAEDLGLKSQSAPEQNTPLQNIQLDRLKRIKLLEQQVADLKRENAKLSARSELAVAEAKEMNKQVAVLNVSAETSLASGAEALLKELNDKNRVLVSVLAILEEIQTEWQENPDRGRDETGMPLEKLRRAIAILKRLNEVPSIVARRDGNSTENVRVLAVDDVLEVAVLNAGSEDGIRLGSIFTVAGDSEDQAVTLKVIEIRRKICAAAVEQGQVSQVKTGDFTTTGK